MCRCVIQFCFKLLGTAVQEDQKILQTSFKPSRLEMSECEYLRHLRKGAVDQSLRRWTTCWVVVSSNPSSTINGSWSKALNSELLCCMNELNVCCTG